MEEGGGVWMKIVFKQWYKIMNYKQLKKIINIKNIKNNNFWIPTQSKNNPKSQLFSKKIPLIPRKKNTFKSFYINI